MPESVDGGMVDPWQVVACGVLVVFSSLTVSNFAVVPTFGELISLSDPI